MAPRRISHRAWRLPVALLAAALFHAGPLRAGSMSAEWCDARWEAESGRFDSMSASGLADLLKFWQAQAPQCSGTVVYEATLAFVHIQMGDLDTARNILAKVSGKPSAYAHMVEINGLQIELAEIGRLPPEKAAAQLPQVEARFAAFVKKYPTWPPGYSLLGTVEGLAGNHRSAIDHLGKAIKLLGDKAQEPNTWGIYRNLTISLAATDQYYSAKGAGEVAYRLNKSVTDDRWFMYALARADAGIGKIKEAQTTLKVIALKKPEVRDDPEFRAAVEFVKARMAESN